MNPPFDPKKLEAEILGHLQRGNALPESPSEPDPLFDARDPAMVLISRKMLEIFRATGPTEWCGMLTAECEGRIMQVRNVRCPPEGDLMRQLRFDDTHVLFLTRLAYLLPSPFASRSAST